jgi:hypothetical protein
MKGGLAIPASPSTPASPAFSVRMLASRSVPIRPVAARRFATSRLSNRAQVPQPGSSACRGTNEARFPPGVPAPIPRGSGDASCRSDRPTAASITAPARVRNGSRLVGGQRRRGYAHPRSLVQELLRLLEASDAAAEEPIARGKTDLGPAADERWSVRWNVRSRWNVRPSFGVFRVMTSPWLVLLLATVAGCMAPAPGGSLALQENEIGDRSFAGYELVPDGVPIPEPRSVADRVVPSDPAPRIRLEIDAGALDVSARGLPAIDVHDGTVVIPELQILQLSTAYGAFDLVWLTASGGREVWPVADGGWTSTRDLRNGVREINASLQERSWRRMEPLAIEYMNPDDAPEDYKERLAPGERPVQVLSHKGELIVRVLGIRVLERHPLVGATDSIHALYADPETATVVAVFMTCTGEDCTCDPEFTVQRMQFDPATLQAIDRHPCVEEDHRGGCGPVDYGFADTAPWA